MSVGLGVVEGFYGRPWSFGARKRIVRLLGDVGLDTYGYAPKSDPLHRARWWEPLGVDQLRAFEELASVARDAGVRIVYGIAPERLFGGRANLKPGSTLGDARFEQLVARCVSLVARGIASFMLLFDDTWPTVVPRFASSRIGERHAAVASALVERLRAVDPSASVTVVPAIYSGRASALSAGARAYLHGLATKGDFSLAWTGPRIFSPYITAREVEAFAKAAGRAVWIWNNAIANDWLPLATGEALGLAGRCRLCFGPVANLAHGAIDASSGVLLNGAREPVVTEVALTAWAEQVRAPTPAGRDADAALSRALDRTFGNAGALVAQLAEQVRGHPIAAAHVRGARPIQEIALRARAGIPGARSALESALVELATLESRLRGALGGHPGWEDLEGTAAKVALVSKALLAKLRNDPDAKRLLKETTAHRWSTSLDELLHDL
ncbi:MAG: hypothetical protein HOW73_50025 [Polyangiaceae bacterium]|nr:hypothetical protein [Polyangiaceae bacterium]